MTKPEAIWLIALSGLFTAWASAGEGEWTRPFASACGPVDAVRLQRNIDDQIKALQVVVVHEDVERYSRSRGVQRRIDSLDAVAEVIDGVETYADVKQNGQQVPHATQITGTWSFGELPAFLQASREALGKAATNNFCPVADGDGLLSSASFHFNADSQRWFVTVDSKLYWLDFSGEIRISPATGQVASIRWTSGEPPAATGIAKIVWTVDFKPAEVYGRTYVLPDKAEYRVIHRGDWVDWNITRFDVVGRYGAQVSVNFGSR